MLAFCFGEPGNKQVRRRDFNLGFGWTHAGLDWFVRDVSTAATLGAWRTDRSEGPLRSMCHKAA